MSEITTVGLDLAKRVVSLCGEDASGRVVLQRTLRREAVLAWFVPPVAVLDGAKSVLASRLVAERAVRIPL